MWPEVNILLKLNNSKSRDGNTNTYVLNLSTYICICVCMNMYMQGGRHGGVLSIECKYSNGIFASCSLFSSFLFAFARFLSFLFFLPRWRQRARQQQRRRLRLALFNNIYIYTLYYLCNSFSNVGEFHLARRGPLYCTWPINFAQVMYIFTFSIISFILFLFYYKNSTTQTHMQTRHA